MTDKIKKIVKVLPGGKALVRAYRNLVGYPGHEAHFTHAYHSDVWASTESASGPGSTFDATRNIREKLPLLFDRLGVKVVLDAPCGDFNWFRHIPRERGPFYIGGDIVAALIEKNRQFYSNDNTQFQKLDIINDPLPAADLWLCRESLFHFSHDHIIGVLKNLGRSEIRYFVSTTMPSARENPDGRTGPYRPLNLSLPPFSLPEPLATIDDWTNPDHVRILGVWEKEALRECLANLDRPLLGSR